jgi:hypothetical protein
MVSDDSPNIEMVTWDQAYLDDSRATLADDLVDVLYIVSRPDPKALCGVILAKFVPTLAPDAAAVVTGYLDPIARSTDPQGFAGHFVSMCEDVKVVLRLWRP